MDRISIVIKTPISNEQLKEALFDGKILSLQGDTSELEGRFQERIFELSIISIEKNPEDFYFQGKLINILRREISPFEVSGIIKPDSTDNFFGTKTNEDQKLLQSYFKRLDKKP